MPATCDVLVIGVASLDVLHLIGQTVSAPGGAGLYTALAAQRAGAHAGLFAPRPEPLPDPLKPAADRLIWIGPAVSPDRLPRLEIAHHGGGRATLIDAAWGAESALTPDLLPPDLLGASIVHVAALSTAERQLRFAQACRARGAARISAGIYARSIMAEPDQARALFEAVDLFFMNENEAHLLFGSIDAARTRSGHTLFVTLGAQGALVIEGDGVTHIPGRPAHELDPTGAGDTLCGTVLAGLARGEDAVIAAQAGIALAAEMIGEIGPARLLR
ncbi:MAG TPA: carbohydrate kinase family protein [Anaerolineae bacterium]|nr:carbohydrate kinase family protein [Anaerolineae bacterium]